MRARRRGARVLCVELPLEHFDARTQSLRATLFSVKLGGELGDLALQLSSLSA